jgi:hypothetical protein
MPMHWTMPTRSINPLCSIDVWGEQKVAKGNKSPSRTKNHLGDLISGTLSGKQHNNNKQKENTK